MLHESTHPSLDEILRAAASSRRIKEQFTGEVGARSKALDLSGGGSPTATWLTVSKSDIFQALDAQNQVLRKQVLGQAEDSSNSNQSDVVQLSARSFASDQQDQPEQPGQQPLALTPPSPSHAQHESGDSSRTLQPGTPLSQSQRQHVPPLPLPLTPSEEESGRSLARHGLARDIVDSSLERTHEPPYSIQPVWNPVTNKIQTTAKPKDFTLGPKETHRRELESLHSSQHHVAYAKQLLEQEAAHVASHLARTHRTHTNPYYNTPYHTHPRSLHLQRPTPCEPYQPQWGAEEASSHTPLGSTLSASGASSTSGSSRRFTHNHSGGLSTASVHGACARAGLYAQRPYSAPPSQLARQHQQQGVASHTPSAYGLPTPSSSSLSPYQSPTQPLPRPSTSHPSPTHAPPPSLSPHPLPDTPSATLPARISGFSNSSSGHSSAALALPAHAHLTLPPPSPPALSIPTPPSAFAISMASHAVRPNSARGPSMPTSDSHSHQQQHHPLTPRSSAPAHYASKSPPRLQVDVEPQGEAARPPPTLGYGPISPIQEEGQEEELQVQDAEAEGALNPELTLAPRHQSRHVSPHPNAPGSASPPSRSPTSPTATSPKSGPFAARTPAPTPTVLGLKGHVFRGGEVDVTPGSTHTGSTHFRTSAGSMQGVSDAHIGAGGYSRSDAPAPGQGMSTSGSLHGLPPALQALPASAGRSSPSHAGSPHTVTATVRDSASDSEGDGADGANAADDAAENGRPSRATHALPLPPHIARPLSAQHSAQQHGASLNTPMNTPALHPGVVQQQQRQQQQDIAEAWGSGTMRIPSSSRPSSAQPRFSPTPTGAAPFQPRLHSVLHRSSTGGRSARPSSAGSLHATHASHTLSHAPPTAAAAAAQQRGGTHWGTRARGQDAYALGSTQRTSEQACSWGEVGGVLESLGGVGAARIQSLALRTRPASASAAGNAHGARQAGLHEKQVSWQPEQATLLSTPRERARARADSAHTSSSGTAFQCGSLPSPGMHAKQGQINTGRPVSARGAAGISPRASLLSGQRRARSARPGAVTQKQQEAVDPLSVVRVELPGSRGSAAAEAHGEQEREAPNSAICMQPMTYMNMVEGVARI